MNRRPSFNSRRTMRGNLRDEPRAWPDFGLAVFTCSLLFSQPCQFVLLRQDTFADWHACLLGQLEYNPRHYGQEEKEAGRHQEESDVAAQENGKQREAAETCSDVGGDSAAARRARHDAGSRVAGADCAYAERRRVFAVRPPPVS